MQNNETELQLSIINLFPSDKEENQEIIDENMFIIEPKTLFSSHEDYINGITLEEHIDYIKETYYKMDTNQIDKRYIRIASHIASNNAMMKEFLT